MCGDDACSFGKARGINFNVNMPQINFSPFFYEVGEMFKRKSDCNYLQMSWEKGCPPEKITSTQEKFSLIINKDSKNLSYNFYNNTAGRSFDGKNLNCEHNQISVIESMSAGLVLNNNPESGLIINKYSKEDFENYFKYMLPDNSEKSEMTFDEFKNYFEAHENEVVSIQQGEAPVEDKSGRLAEEKVNLDAGDECFIRDLFNAMSKDQKTLTKEEFAAFMSDIYNDESLVKDSDLNGQKGKLLTRETFAGIVAKKLEEKNIQPTVIEGEPSTKEESSLYGRSIITTTTVQIADASGIREEKTVITTMNQQFDIKHAIEKLEDNGYFIDAEAAKLITSISIVGAETNPIFYIVTLSNGVQLQMNVGYHPLSPTKPCKIIMDSDNTLNIDGAIEGILIKADYGNDGNPPKIKIMNSRGVNYVEKNGLTGATLILENIGTENKYGASSQFALGNGGTNVQLNGNNFYKCKFQYSDLENTFEGTGVNLINKNKNSAFYDFSYDGYIDNDESMNADAMIRKRSKEGENIRTTKEVKYFEYATKAQAQETAQEIIALGRSNGWSEKQIKEFLKSKELDSYYNESNPTGIVEADMSDNLKHDF